MYWIQNDKYSRWRHSWKHGSSTGKTFLKLPLPAFLSPVQSSSHCVLQAISLSAIAVSVRTAASHLPFCSPPLTRRIPSCSSLTMLLEATRCAAKLFLRAPAVSPTLATFSDVIAACFQNKFSQISQKIKAIKKNKVRKMKSRYSGNLCSVNITGLCYIMKIKAVS